MYSEKKETKHVPLHRKLEQLESSLSKKIGFINKRITIIENIILKEFGTDRVLEGHSIINFLKTNLNDLYRQFHLPKVEYEEEEEDPMDLDFDVTFNDTADGDEEDDLHYTQPVDTSAAAAGIKLKAEGSKNSCVDESDEDPWLSFDTPPVTVTTRSGRKVKSNFPSASFKPRSAPLGRRREGGKESTWKRANNDDDGPLQSPMCEQCGASFTNKSNLRTHQATLHGSQNNFKCEECEESFRTEFKRNLHVRTHHDTTNRRAHHCDICQASFLSRTNLETHRRVHTGVRLYPCADCSKSYKHRTGYLRHRLSAHDNFRPYGCPKCEKKFFESNHARRHLITVHKIMEKLEIPKERQGPPPPEKGPKPPPPRRIRKYGRIFCEICGSNILTKGYKAHLKIHSTDVTCGICGKGFPTESALKIHEVQAHDPTRSHACGRCDAKFKQRTTLRQHYLLKHSLKPWKYSCQECGQTYKCQSSLAKHVNAIHTHEKLFSCIKCFRIYHSSSHLKRHLLRVHKVGVEELKEHGLTLPNLAAEEQGKDEDPMEERDPPAILDCEVVLSPDGSPLPPKRDEDLTKE